MKSYGRIRNLFLFSLCARNFFVGPAVSNIDIFSFAEKREIGKRDLQREWAGGGADRHRG